jgi:HPt (histidine-containing phosphotransfer) domain-containing protein
MLMEQPNLNYINNLSGNDKVFKELIINTLKKELPLEINEYRNKIENDCFTASAEIIHKIKHKISIMGMEKSYYLAEEFEISLKKESVAFKEVLKVEFDEILSAMQDFVDSL